MKFLVFAASHRPDSYNRKLVQLAATQVTSTGNSVDFAEYAEFDLPVYNDTMEPIESVKTIGRRIENVQGLILSLPEYNWSYPGSLKNIIDWVSCLTPNPLKGKTALLMSASPGARGGILGLDHLKSPLESCEVFVFNKVFPLGSCNTAFNDDDQLRGDKQQKLFSDIVGGFVTFTRKLANNGSGA